MTLLTGEEIMARKGWGWPMLSKKAHWFERAVSICGRWGYAGRLEGKAEDAGGPDDCRACVKKLRQRTVPR